MLVPVGTTPTVDSVVSDTNFVCRLTDINFIGFGSNYVDYWFWGFTDNSVDYGMFINYIFQDTGFISGRVTASFRGCFDTLELGNYYIKAPIATFTVLDSCERLRVDFEDASIGAQRWFWDFGDPTTTADTSTAQHPR